MFDGDAADPDATIEAGFHTDFSRSRISTLDMNPMSHQFSNIDVTATRQVERTRDFFTLFDFSAKMGCSAQHANPKP